MNFTQSINFEQITILLKDCREKSSQEATQKKLDEALQYLTQFCNECENQARRSESILDGAGLGSWDWWLADNRVQFDRHWCEMLGLKLNEVPQTLASWESRVHPGDLSKAYQDIEAYLMGRT